MAMTDISNPMAHQLPLHNHRGGLVQPSLVMNHHLDMDCHGNDIRISKCGFDDFVFLRYYDKFSLKSIDSIETKKCYLLSFSRNMTNKYDDIIKEMLGSSTTVQLHKNFIRSTERNFCR